MHREGPVKMTKSKAEYNSHEQGLQILVFLIMLKHIEVIQRRFVFSFIIFVLVNVIAITGIYIEVICRK